MTPTKNQLDKWMPDQLVLAALPMMAELLRGKLDQAERKFDLPTSDWKGQARTAAENRSTEEATWGKRVAAGYETLGTTLSEAATGIGGTLTAVDNAIADASGKGFHLISGDDPEWLVRYVPAEDDDSSEEKRAQLRHEWSAFLKGKADTAEQTCQQYAATVTASLQSLAELTPAVLGLSAADGRTAAMMSADGWTPEELEIVGRSLEAAGLTPEQAQRLLNGERVEDLPVGAQEFLHQFYNNLSMDQTLGLQSEFDNLGTDEGTTWSKALGSGLLILSNEKVGAGSVHGGFDSLPQWMRDWSTHRDRDEWIVNLGGKPTNIAAQDYKIAKMLANTGSGIAPGERLGTELIRKSETEMAWKQHSELITGSFPGAEVSDQQNNYETTMENLLSVGTRSHEASAAILSGHYSDGTALDGDYNRDRTVQNLLAHEWREQDNGKTAANLVNWVDDYAADQTDAHRAELSARAFRGLLDSTSATGDQFGNLMNIGASEKSVGDLNPAVAAAIEESIRPYLNVMSGGSPEMYGFDTSTHNDLDFGNDADALRDQSQRAMALAASDPETAARLVHDVQAQQALNVHNLVTLEPDASAVPNATEVGARNGGLQNLLTDGLTAAELDDWHDEHLGSGTSGLSNDDRAAISSNVEETIKKVAGGLPVVGNTAEFGLDLASPWVPAWDADVKAPDQGPTPTNVPDAVENAQLHQYYQMYASTNPAPSDLDPLTADRLFEHGKLKPLNELVDEFGQGNQNQLIGLMRPQVDSAGVDVGAYDTQYSRYEGDPTEAMSYEEYRNRLLDEG
ncbi:hypothetical protein KXR83_06705 [Williamsia muralis]|uniref:TPR repeat region-containing protein n=1 Tax=Williamsia marianensis TaxID=85044 RepID=UPI003F158779